jgi:hypothetical protein
MYVSQCAGLQLMYFFNFLYCARIKKAFIQAIASESICISLTLFNYGWCREIRDGVVRFSALYFIVGKIYLCLHSLL